MTQRKCCAKMKRMNSRSSALLLKRSAFEKVPGGNEDEIKGGNRDVKEDSN